MTGDNQFLGNWITVLGVNPEPWAVGSTYAKRTATGIRSGLGPNLKLQAYQKALREEIEARHFQPVINESVRLTIKMLFVRQVDSWRDAGGKTKTGNYADATNLGKGTEDALQGVLFPNDRQMAWSWPVIVEQGLTVEPFVAILIQPYEDGARDRDLVNLMRNRQATLEASNGDGPSW